MKSKPFLVARSATHLVMVTQWTFQLCQEVGL